MSKVMKIFGISEVVKHPQGFDYVVAYLTKEKTLGNSLMLVAWNRKTKDKIEVE